MSDPNELGSISQPVAAGDGVIDTTPAGNPGAAILAGLAAALIGAVLWALVTVQIKYQIGFMAVGVGFLVAWAVRKFGGGETQVYGVIGAVCALLGCVTGNLLSVCGFVAEARGQSALAVVASVLNHPAAIPQLLQAAFNPMDLLFYAIAVYEGYKLARRPTQRSVIQARS